MKNLIVVLMLCLVSIVNAEIPGFLDLYFATGRDYLSQDGDTKDTLVGISEVKINYGVHLPFYFDAYISGGWKTFYNVTPNHTFSNNYPYRDIYSMGATIEWKQFLFIQYEHVCSHAVFSGNKENDYSFYSYRGRNFLLMEGMPTAAYDKIMIGIKCRIE